jgi:hypothetical protein
MLLHSILKELLYRLDDLLDLLELIAVVGFIERPFSEQ